MITWAVVWLDKHQTFESGIPLICGIIADCVIVYYAASGWAGRPL